MAHSPPGSFIHAILPARILEWVAIPFSRESSQPRDRIQVSCIEGGFFIIWAIRKAPEYFDEHQERPHVGALGNTHKALSQQASINHQIRE